jgi:4-amino-4-deoxy-L-arabinose transferase-like glycosyltransferase
MIDMVSTNGDPIFYWGAAKSLFSNGGYVDIFQQSARFGVILPLYIFQLLFGTSPISYYLPLILVNVLMTYYLYKMILLLSDEVKAFFVTLTFILFPLSWIYGYAYFMHPYPGPFETLFVLISFYYLTLWSFKKPKIKYVIIASIFMFLAYESKETAVIMILGGIFILHKNKKHLIIYSGILAMLFICEIILYKIVAEIDFGRLGAMQSHFEDPGQYLVYFNSPFDLLKRFTVGLKHPSKIMFWLFFLFTPYYLIKNKSRQTKHLLIIAYSFIIPITFAVKSINPVQIALPFNTRYLNIVLPYVTAINVFGIIRAIEWCRKKTFGIKFKKETLKKIHVRFVVLLCAAAFIFCILYKKTIHYKIYLYNKLIDDAVLKNMAIVQKTDTDNRHHSTNELDVAARMFMDNPDMIRETIKTHSVYPHILYISTTEDKTEPALSDEVVFVQSTPFGAHILKLKNVIE